MELIPNVTLQLCRRQCDIDPSCSGIEYAVGISICKLYSTPDDVAFTDNANPNCVDERCFQCVSFHVLLIFVGADLTDEAAWIVAVQTRLFENSRRARRALIDDPADVVSILVGRTENVTLVLRDAAAKRAVEAQVADPAGFCVLVNGQTFCAGQVEQSTITTTPQPLQEDHRISNTGSTHVQNALIVAIVALVIAIAILAAILVYQRKRFANSDLDNSDDSSSMDWDDDGLSRGSLQRNDNDWTANWASPLRSVSQMLKI